MYLGARVQSCICWSSETRAAGGAPEQLRTEIGLFLAVSDDNSAAACCQNSNEVYTVISTAYFKTADARMPICRSESPAVYCYAQVLSILFDYPLRMLVFPTQDILYFTLPALLRRATGDTANVRRSWSDRLSRAVSNRCCLEAYLDLQ